MAEGAFNIQEIAKQLGLKDIRELPIIRAIQLTLPAGAESADLGPPMLAPSAWVGLATLIVLLERGSIQLLSLAPGGSMIEELWYSEQATALNGFRFKISSTNPFPGLPELTVNKQELSPTPTVSRFFGGTTTVPLGSNNPSFGQPVAGGSGRPMQRRWHLPKGQFFSFQARDANNHAEFALRFTDLPAANLTPTG